MIVGLMYGGVMSCRVGIVYGRVAIGRISWSSQIKQTVEFGRKLYATCYNVLLVKFFLLSIFQMILK